MAYVDADGLIVPEPAKGDVLRMTYVLRRDDYGALSVPAPVLIGHHHTARWMPDGETSTNCVEMGRRANKRPYYAHLYVGRDGAAVQIVRYGRACKGIESSLVVAGKKREVNRVSFQIEWDNWGVATLAGKRGGGAHGVSPKREDARRDKREMWQITTPVQARAIAEVCVAIVRKSHMRAIDALHGHLELGRGSHPDPNPAIIADLELVVAPALGLGVVKAPARNTKGPRSSIPEVRA